MSDSRYDVTYDANNRKAIREICDYAVWTGAAYC